MIIGDQGKVSIACGRFLIHPQVLQTKPLKTRVYNPPLQAQILPTPKAALFRPSILRAIGNVMGRLELWETREKVSSYTSWNTYFFGTLVVTSSYW